MAETALHLDPSQERAVELVCTAPLGVVTGGPGTGKTTCLRVALDRLERRGAIVKLASPTGKAARRLEEATGRSASTLHRLLEYHPAAPPPHFLRTAAAPLECDLVVVDETSMLDVELADALLSAVQSPTRLVFVGDADQLPSVGPGRVFADLITSARVPVARLTTLHRAAAESWVCSQAPEVLAGRVPDLRPRKDFLWVEQSDRARAVDALLELVTGTLPRSGVSDAQVLVPQNVGPAGAELLNRVLQGALNDRAPGSGWKVGRETELRVGDRVIQTRNDYTLRDSHGGEGVFNGEVGRVARIDNENGWLTVDFDAGSDSERLVHYDRDRAGALALAYALTGHRAQGSEWPWVVVLVHSTHTRMLTRQWLYTAVTRARQGVVIVGDRLGIERAVKNVSDARRNTSLVERLRSASV